MLQRDQSALLGAVRYFLRLGATGFGGPVALAERMHRDLVTERGWIDESRFREGLAFAQLAPGPLAAQLAMYIGWLRAGVAGAIGAGVAFIAPSFVLVVAAAAAYQRVGGLPWVAGALYGAGAAVIALIARAGYRLAVVSLRKDALLWAICAVNFALVALTRAEHVAAVVASAVVVWGMRGRSPGSISMPAIAVAATPGAASPPLLTLLWFFVKSGTVVFGSGLAIVPFLYGGVVEQHQWLNDRQFLDAVAVGLLSPGPIVITVAFIGYLVAGLSGALVAAVGVFLPVLVIVTVAAPYVARVTASPSAKAAVDGAVAAAIGALLGAVVILASRSLTDGVTWTIAVTGLVIILWTRRVPDVAVLASAAIVGVLARATG
jgi:chromate transporter